MGRRLGRSHCPPVSLPVTLPADDPACRNRVRGHQGQRRRRARRGGEVREALTDAASMRTRPRRTFLDDAMLQPSSGENPAMRTGAVPPKAPRSALAPPDSGATPPRTLERLLGPHDLTLLVIGAVIGSGIFIVPAVVLRQTGGA